MQRLLMMVLVSMVFAMGCVVIVAQPGEYQQPKPKPQPGVAHVTPQATPQPNTQPIRPEVTVTPPAGLSIPATAKYTRQDDCPVQYYIIGNLMERNKNYYYIAVKNTSRQEVRSIDVKLQKTKGMTLSSARVSLKRNQQDIVKFSLDKKQGLKSFQIRRVVFTTYPHWWPAMVTPINRIQARRISWQPTDFAGIEYAFMGFVDYPKSMVAFGFGTSRGVTFAIRNNTGDDLKNLKGELYSTEPSGKERKRSFSIADNLTTVPKGQAVKLLVPIIVSGANEKIPVIMELTRVNNQKPSDKPEPQPKPKPRPRPNHPEHGQQNAPGQIKPKPDKPGQNKPKPDAPGQAKPKPDKPGQNKPEKENVRPERPNWPPQPKPEAPGQAKPKPDKPGQNKPEMMQPKPMPIAKPEAPAQAKPKPDKPGQNKPKPGKPDKPESAQTLPGPVVLPDPPAAKQDPMSAWKIVMNQLAALPNLGRNPTPEAEKAWNAKRLAVVPTVTDFLANHGNTPFRVPARNFLVSAYLGNNMNAEAIEQIDALLADKMVKPNSQAQLMEQKIKALKDMGKIEAAWQALGVFKTMAKRNSMASMLVVSTELYLRQLMKRDPMPAFNATAIGGAALNADSLKGKVVLLHFWHTYDGAEQLEQIKPLADRYGEQLVIIGINGDQTSAANRAYHKAGSRGKFPVPEADIQKMCADKGAAWAQVYDAKTKGTAFMFGVGPEDWPTTLVFGADGRLISKGQTGDALLQTLALHLKTKPGAPTPRGRGRR